MLLTDFYTYENLVSPQIIKTNLSIIKGKRKKILCKFVLCTSTVIKTCLLPDVFTKNYEVILDPVYDNDSKNLNNLYGYNLC